MNLNESNFDNVVLSETNKETILVDFWGPWCGPCNAMMPMIDKLAKIYKIAKVNVDENTNLATRYNISAVPAMLFFKEGKLVKKLVGIQKEADIVKIFEETA